jgi:hypothetical protein
MKIKVFALLLVFIIFTIDSNANDQIYLRDNLKQAKKGDYIVTVQNKMYTLLHIYDKVNNNLTIEEISVPMNRVPKNKGSWRDWIALGAPYNTSWVMYVIDLTTGRMNEFFSLSKNGWYDMPQSENFLSTLLNLRLNHIPLKDRKRIGTRNEESTLEGRNVWQPQMIVEGHPVPGVFFEAWKAFWPNDGSPLSGKTIELFIPKENDKYPSYFPYWLQISGFIGKAKIRIIDSGSNLKSPAPPLRR